ncbi:MAG: recombination protein RecR [Planctomycetes bacterium]|nr:recombination protein RecR [Planctomycetota bacterium]
MAGYTKSVERLQAEFAKLPGIGARSAERLAFHVLKAPREEALALAEAIADVKANVRPCSVCFNLAEDRLCEICSDAGRDAGCICVVEQPKDLLSLEVTGVFSGVYHVLMGQIAPLDGVEPEDLTIDQLLARVRKGGVREVILATNPTVAGDVTALHIVERLKDLPSVKVTRLARGLPVGGSIEYSNQSILTDALNERREL